MSKRHGYSLRGGQRLAEKEAFEAGHEGEGNEPSGHSKEKHSGRRKERGRGPGWARSWWEAAHRSTGSCSLTGKEAVEPAEPGRDGLWVDDLTGRMGRPGESGEGSGRVF